MKLIQRLEIKLSDEERNHLREAAEILKGIRDLLVNNRENGFAAFQEGLIITDAFWDLKHSFEAIEKEELIP